MTTYDASSVSDAVIAFRKPITLQQGRGLRDNPIAMAEGASGAPRVQTIALSGIRQTKLSVTGNSYITITDLDAYKWVRLECGFIGDGSTRFIDVSLSSNNGSTWSTTTTVGESGTTTPIGFLAFIGLTDGMVTGIAANGRFSEISGFPFNALRIRQRISVSTDNILTVVPYFMEART